MLHFIVNPNAKGIGKLTEKISEKLKTRGIDFEFHASTGKEETRSLAARLTETPATVIAVGGDGTLNDVICGIHPENTTLGLIPTGTGNDFAAACKIPKGIAALDLILTKEAQFTDFIECDNGLRSINIAGLGIDVDILERCYRMEHGSHRGKYFKGLLASLRHYEGQKIEITVNGETHTETAFIAAVCNGRQFGGGIPMCPPAVIDDGKLDLVVVSTPKRWRYPLLLLRLKLGSILREPDVRHVQCESVRIVQEENSTVELDGELVSSTVLSAHVVHGVLRMFRS